MKDCRNKAITYAVLLGLLHIITAPKNSNRVHWFDVITSMIMSWLGMNAILLLCLMDQMDVPWIILNICFLVFHIWYFFALWQDDIAALNAQKIKLSKKIRNKKQAG